MHDGMWRDNRTEANVSWRIGQAFYRSACISAFPPIPHAVQAYLVVLLCHTGVGGEGRGGGTADVGQAVSLQPFPHTRQADNSKSVMVHDSTSTPVFRVSFKPTRVREKEKSLLQLEDRSFLKMHGGSGKKSLAGEEDAGFSYRPAPPFLEILT